MTLTNDKLLRDSITERLKNDSRCLFFPELSDFSSYIRLTKEKLTKDFIKGLVQRATEKFFVKNDVSTLCYREKVGSKIHDKTKQFFDDPESDQAAL